MGTQLATQAGMTNFNLLSSGSLSGTRVTNANGEDLGTLKEIMLDTHHGRIAYGVLSFGGFLGLGDKLFAIPWSSLHVNTADKCILFDVAEEQLADAQGFDKDDWPDMADHRWHTSIYERWGAVPYWEEVPPLA